MALRNIRLLTPLINSIRNSSSQSLVNISIDEKNGIATATLNKPPVNSLNLELLTDLSQTLQQLETNKVRGLILTSSSNKVFSAGLDILEMYQPNLDRFKQFWSTLQTTWINLYSSSFPTVAVINGHSPAGGCLLALSCEYRIMLPNFTIGLNETQLGIVAPKWFIDPMKNTIGVRQAELALTSGHLFQTDEALKVGLVDQVASTKEEGIEEALKFFKRFARVPPHARTQTKKAIRGPVIQNLLKTKDEELEMLPKVLLQPHVQKSLEKYLEALKK